jgi:hypothetical protein
VVYEFFSKLIYIQQFYCTAYLCNVSSSVVITFFCNQLQTAWIWNRYSYLCNIKLYGGIKLFSWSKWQPSWMMRNINRDNVTLCRLCLLLNFWMNWIHLRPKWGLVKSNQCNVTSSKHSSHWNYIPHYWPVTSMYVMSCHMRLYSFPYPIKVNLLEWYLKIRKSMQHYVVFAFFTCFQ